MLLSYTKHDYVTYIHVERHFEYFTWWKLLSSLFDAFSMRIKFLWGRGYFYAWKSDDYEIYLLLFLCPAYSFSNVCIIFILCFLWWLFTFDSTIPNRIIGKNEHTFKSVEKCSHSAYRIQETFKLFKPPGRISSWFLYLSFIMKLLYVYCEFGRYIGIVVE